MVPCDFLYQRVKENLDCSFYSKVVMIKVYGVPLGLIFASRFTLADIMYPPVFSIIGSGILLPWTFLPLRS